VDHKYSLFNHLRKEQAMKKLSLIVILLISLALAGCAGMSDTEQRTLSGAAIGTAAGGVVGAIAGHTGVGLAAGAVAGAAGGYLYDHHEKAKKASHDKAYEQGYEAGKKNQ
jgi:osmotically inducible lipoprotein OsmB